MKRLFITGPGSPPSCAAGCLAAFSYLCFILSVSAQYSITHFPTIVKEGDTVNITVTRGSTSDPDNVTVRAVPGSALPTSASFPYPDYDDGDLPKTDFFDPPTGTFTSRDYTITIIDESEAFAENEEDFFIQVLDGSTVIAEKQIIIEANDQNGNLAVIPNTNDIITLPDTFLDDRGTIQVTSSNPPPGAGWRLVGETRWRPINSSADSALVIDFNGGSQPDAHEIEFLPVPGFNLSFSGDSIDPLARQIIVPDNNTTVSVDVTYTPNSNGIGDLQVDLYPDDIQTSGVWRIRNYDIDTIPGDDTFGHGTSIPLPAGFYEIYFDEIAGFEIPRPRMVQVVANQRSIIEATYLRNDSAGNGSSNPLSPLDYFDISVSTPGIQGTGQVRTNIAKATGVAVGRFAVLTTAQAIFNPKRLTSTYKIRWTHQRQTSGTVTGSRNNPPPQIPRGWYIFNNYSAALDSSESLGNAGDLSTTDLSNSVAALFFKDPCAKNGLTGYLGSTLAQTIPFLEDSSYTKFIAGYGLSENVSVTAQSNDGILYKSPDLQVALTPIGNNLYRGGGFSNQIGGSEVGSFLGTALFLRDDRDTNNINDIPAGIVVGTFDFSGSQELLIRAFDPVLAELVQRATFSAATDSVYSNTPNSSDSNGIGSFGISISSLGGGFGGSGGGGFGDEETTGSLAITLDPGGAVTQGAKWGFDSGNPNDYESEEQVDDLLAGTRSDLTYNDADGYYDPTDDSYTIVAEQTTADTKDYTENEELLWIKDEFDSGDWETGSIVSASANPDGDPYNNAVERALNGNPEVADDLLNLSAEADSLEITVDPDTSQTDMTLTIYMGATPSGATGKSTIAAQTNEGMTSWPTTGTNVSATDNGNGTWTIEDTNTGGARFFYIEATSSNPDYAP
jgi:hypothetical protein